MGDLDLFLIARKRICRNSFVCCRRRWRRIVITLVVTFFFCKTEHRYTAPMTVYPLDEKHIPEWSSLLRQGLLCIYPTDSLYGIGGIASSRTAAAVKKVKGREKEKSLSVIAPSLQWIREHCAVPAAFDFSYHQPTTYLFRKKETGSFPYLSETDRLGVRLLPSEHVIQKLVATVQHPLISTSANYSGKPVGSTLEDIPESLRASVAFVIDAGVSLTTPSRLLDADTGKEVPRV